MASLQKKGDFWHCQFTYQHQRRTWVIGAVGDREAKAIKAKVEYLLMRIKQHLLEVPAGRCPRTSGRHPLSFGMVDHLAKRTGEK